MENQKSINGKCLLGLLFLLGCLLGCNPSASLEGTYVNNSSSEFSVASDTLVVEQGEGNQFLLHRSTGFRLLDDAGKPGKLQLEKEEWRTVLDADQGVLTETSKGLVIGISAEGDVLTAGKRKYKRIK